MRQTPSALVGQNLREENGITLIETLMVVAIFGILMVAIQAMFLAGMNVFNREQAESEERRQLYYAAEQMIKVVRNTPLSNITLSGSVNGIYDKIRLVSASGTETEFYLTGSTLYRRSAGVERLVAENIEVLRFEVVCNVLSGTYDSFEPATLRILDSDGSFSGHDPDIKGMIIRFTNTGTGTPRYIYRKIVDYGVGWLKLDADFSPTLQPTEWSYAVGKTYRIYLRNRADGSSTRGTEVTTGVTPRF